ncbi:unnamed protein product [Medioppia subpectinata]|uniref:Uncharacterized protein n=1 Tax=Medioppia subpectinata TaxID=1979941 RepID=A0A7R9KCV1_9ACAR|nr:unnamed protein product [Medioppia subpectinata]CAG2101154.1 unnamed protein product [Medioppia subpectinata]
MRATSATNANTGCANTAPNGDKLLQTEPHKQFNAFNDGIKESAAVVREKRSQRGQQQYFHYQYEPYNRSNYYTPGTAGSEQPFM